MNYYIKKGRFVYPDGSVYSGEYKGNIRQGYGIYAFSDGEKYEGEFRLDEKDGQGIYTWPDGVKYIGDFSNGKMNGDGIYIYSDGTKYTGQWVNNEKHGKGTYSFINGKKIECSYKMGVFCEDVKIIDKNGGSANNNTARKESNMLRALNKVPEVLFIKHGTAIDIVGNKFTGECNNGCLNGHGLYESISGDRYIGNFVNDKREGLGSYIWADGKKYIGEFANDRPHGSGCLMLQDDKKIITRFIKGKAVNENNIVEILIKKNSMDLVIKMYMKNENMYENEDCIVKAV